MLEEKNEVEEYKNMSCLDNTYNRISKIIFF